MVDVIGVVLKLSWRNFAIAKTLYKIRAALELKARAKRKVKNEKGNRFRKIADQTMA